MMGKGRVCLVLHLHMPFVLNHWMWPHGAGWLSEAVVECYLPLLEVLGRLTADGIVPRWTLGVSPVLAEQLASADVRQATEEFLAARLAACSDDRQYFERTQQGPLAALTHHWERDTQRLQETFRRMNGDVLGALRAFQEAGAVELITSAATHAYLPLLSRDESIHLQLRQGVETHRRHFGRAPRGIWLPECGYRPRYEWRPPARVGRSSERRLRPGIEELLVRHGLEAFVLDHHQIANVRPVSWYGEAFPELRQLPGSEYRPLSQKQIRTPYAPWRVTSRGGTGEAVAFIRDPQSTLLVWNRDSGFPGEDWYLEYHKKHLPGGIRYWRVTGRKSDLEAKAPYEPERAAQYVTSHAQAFLEQVEGALAGQLAESGRPGLVCAAFDAELFGHWWHEGPAWLETVARQLVRLELPSSTLSEAAQAAGPIEKVLAREGSWGEGGDHRVWLNRHTEWMWDRLYDAEEELCQAAAALPGARRAHPALGRVLTQAGRELTLLQASDWPFMVTTGSVRDYAEWRFAEHYADFKGLMELARKLGHGEPLCANEEGYVGRLERTNFLFPDLDLRWLAPQAGGDP